jgi:CRP-like cAMP-binding protein
MSKPQPKTRDDNRILASLPPADYRRISRLLEPVPFRRGQPLHDPGRRATHAYFPRTGVASVVARFSDGTAIEVATIGNEGLVGLSAYLADGRNPMEVFVQVPGEAVRMDADAFRLEIRSGGALRDLARRYAFALLVQVGQSAACNRIHSLDQRCARWLLMTHDRVLGDDIALTQEYLAEMLGVRRAGVTQAAHALKRRRLIDYHRGSIQVIDRKGLERAACECYALIRGEHEALIG